MDAVWTTPDPYALVAAACFFGLLPWAQRLDPDFPRWLRLAGWALLPLGLVLAAVRPGPLAALLAAPAGLLALWIFAHGLRRFLSDDLAPLPRRLLEMLAASGPLVAAAAWIWSRYDRTFAGFPEPLATLTTVHFSIPFAVLPLAMAAVERRAPPSRLRSAALLAYVAGAPLTALCFALRPSPLEPTLPEVACAVAFAAGFLAWAAGLPARAATAPLVLLVPGFALGAGYTAATCLGWPYLTIPEMAAFHGTLNLAGTLLLAARAPALDPVVPPAPDRAVPLDAGDVATALFVDRHRRELGPWSPDAFARVRDVLLGYRFYPPAVMLRRTAFEEEGRPVRLGDRLGLGLVLTSLPGLPPLLLPAVAEVHLAESGPERASLGYRTTLRHYGRGEWRAVVRREGERLVLEVDCHVRPSRWYVWLGLPVYRRFQRAAFDAGADNLRAAAASVSAPARSPA